MQKVVGSAVLLNSLNIGREFFLCFIFVQLHVYYRQSIPRLLRQKSREVAYSPGLRFG